LRLPKGSSALPIERDAWAFLEAAGITSALQQRAVVQLVRDLKKAQLWTKMKAVYPFVGGTATTHKWNLKDPQDTDAAFRLIFSGGWTHSSNGALPNGTNAYANTYLNASTLTSSNAHQSFYSRTDANGLHFDIGASNIGSTEIISLYGRFIGNSLADIGNYLASRISVAVADSLGLYVVSRTSNTSLKLYKVGAEIGSNTSTDTATLPNATINLSAVLLQGYSQYSVRQCAFATIGDGLTDAEASLLYQCVDRYQKTLGRAV
jgi:hypothetical protein